MQKRKFLYLGLMLAALHRQLRFNRTTFGGGGCCGGGIDGRMTRLEYLCSQPGVLLHYLKLSVFPEESLS